MLRKITQLTFGLILSLNFFQSSAQVFSQYIVVDQFGYTTKANKFAVIRDPQTGQDAGSSFTPGTTYVLIDAASGQTVFTDSPVAWKSGNTDASSGDKVWWFDFTSVETPGRYFIKDVSKNEQTAEFVIADNVYKDVLKAAMRMLYYQRSSFEKKAPYAGVGWTDGASHLGAGQDNAARVYNKKADASTAKDLHGGWYDAGDYNKYTAWTASYVITLLTAYNENPSAFTDDSNIPESGNGIPDIIDEVKWGLDHLLRMQQTDGSCLSVLGSAGASPPSSATGPSYYGLASTNATLKCAEAFALAAKVFKQVDATAYTSYSATLQTQAIAAWDWAVANPNVKFYNNDDALQAGSANLAAGQQETDDMGRLHSKLGASVRLYDLTGQTSYLTFFEDNYTKVELVKWSSTIDQYRLECQTTLLFYLTLPGISSTVANDIKSRTVTAINKSGDFADALFNETDPYRAFIKDYNWGSNKYKANYGNLFWEVQNLALDNSSNNESYLKASEEYLHYIHGVNPFGLVYLTNMSSYGAENSAKEMYHTWFADKSALWDRVGTSTYGPPPGYLTGGANSSYKWDKCCGLNDCGWSGNTAICTSTTIPTGQPAQKSYKDFNTSWPLNSWELTETSLGYQTAYIRLLSKYTTNTGTAFPMATQSKNSTLSISMKPNPTADLLTIEIPASAATSDMMTVELYNMLGNKVLSKNIENNSTISLSNLSEGVYVVKVSQNGASYTDRVVKMK